MVATHHFSLLPDRFFSSFHFATDLVTTGSMKQYLQPIQVAQVVQLLQDDTSICAATRRFAVSPSSLNSMEEIPGDGPLHEESWTGPKKGKNLAAGTSICSFV